MFEERIAAMNQRTEEAMAASCKRVCPYFFVMEVNEYG